MVKHRRSGYKSSYPRKRCVKKSRSKCKRTKSCSWAKRYSRQGKRIKGSCRRRLAAKVVAKDAKGRNIYKTDSGALYVKVTSKNGKQYKKYLK